MIFVSGFIVSIIVGISLRKLKLKISVPLALIIPSLAIYIVFEARYKYAISGNITSQGGGDPMALIGYIVLGVPCTLLCIATLLKYHKKRINRTKD
jgi:hypothetical protein